MITLYPQMSNALPLDSHFSQLETKPKAADHKAQLSLALNVLGYKHVLDLYQTDDLCDGG